jgi:hypothetical protein
VTTRYELNCGQPVLHRDGIPVSRCLDSVAIAFSKNFDGEFCLHKHGDPAQVKRWVDTTKAKLLQGDKFSREAAENLRLLEIDVPIPPKRFPVELLNRAIARNQAALDQLIGSTQVVDVIAHEVGYREGLPRAT